MQSATKCVVSGLIEQELTLTLFNPFSTEQMELVGFVEPRKSDLNSNSDSQHFRCHFIYLKILPKKNIFHYSRSHFVIQAIIFA